MSKHNPHSYDPAIYIRHNDDGYYVGQSAYGTIRSDTGGHGKKVASYPASEDGALRHLQETEMIQFMDAAGVPLTNKQQRYQPDMSYQLSEEWR